MVVAFVRSHTAVADKAASSTTVNLNISTVTTVGNTLVAYILYDNAATASKPLVSAIARAVGETNTWTQVGAVNSTSTSAGAFASGSVWTIRTSVAWPVATYAVTLDTAVTQKATLVQEFSGALGTLRSTSGTNYSTTTTAASASTTGTAPVTGDLAVGFIFGSNAAAAQAGDNDTSAGAWSAVAGFGTTGGNVATNNFGVAQYKILTAATAQTLNNSAAMTAGNGAIVGILQQYVDPSITQAASRFYADGTETGSTALAAQDTAPTVDVSAGDVNAQVRVRLQATTAVAVDSWDDFQLQWEKNASGSWTAVAAGATVAAYNSANLTDGGATTNRLTGGTGTFTAGKVSEDGLVDDLGWAGNNHTELLYSLTFKKADVANADTIRFRVLRNGVTTGLTYTQVPTVTIDKHALTPVASFTATPTTLQTGETVTFTDTSLYEPTTWAWNFGTGASPATASTKGPHVVTYSTVGTSMATLTVSNTAGSDAVDTPTSITVTPAPAVTLAQYRFYADGIEGYSTPLAAQNVSAPGDVSLGDANLQLRALLQSTNATAIPATDDWQLQWEKNSSGTWSPVAPAGSYVPESLVDSYSETNADNVSALHVSQQRVGQTFLGNGAPLKRAGFWLAKVGAPDGSIFAELYAHPEAFGSATSIGIGSLLATSTTVLSSASVSTTAQWVDFDFDSTFTLVNGTPYLIVARTTSTLAFGNHHTTGRDISSPTHAGQEARYGTTQWSVTTFDTIFRVYSGSAFTTVVAHNSANLTDAAVTTRRMGVIDEYDTTATIVGNTVGTTATASGQTFRGTGTPVGAVYFFLTKSTGATGNAVVKIYAHTGTFGSGGLPTGTALATSDGFDVSTLSNITSRWIEFTFSGGNQITLTNGTPYVAVIEYSGAFTILVVAVSATVDSLHSGNRVTYTSSWASATTDALFKVISTTGTGTGTFVSGKISEDGLVDDLGWTGNNFTEVLYALTLKQADLTNSDTLRFRILRNGATSSFTYTQTPTLAITNVPLAVTQAAYQFYADGPESTSTALAVFNTAYAADLSGGDANLQVRALLQSTSVTSPPATDDWQLQWEKNASGTWVNVEPTELYEGYDESHRGAFNTLTANLGSGESFLGNGQKLRRAGFNLYRSGTPTFTITAQLYAHSGTFGTSGIGTGTALAISTTSKLASDLGLGTANVSWVDFDFDGTYTLVNGTPYVIAVIFSFATDASNYVGLGSDSIAPVYPGSRTSLTSGSVWNSQPGDIIFRVYTDRPSVPDTVVGHYSANVIEGAVTSRRVGVITENNAISGSGSQFGVAPSTSFGETFQGAGVPVVSVQFRLYSAGSTGNAVAKIYAHSGTFGAGGVPTGTALATSDPVNVATLPTSISTAWTEFRFSGGNQITLTAGTPYAVVVEYTGATNISITHSTGTGGYAGNAVYYSGTWATLSNDVFFKVFSTGTGTGTWTPGKVAEDGMVDDLGWPGNGVTELLYAVTLKQADLAGNNTLRFRILRNGATAGLTYTQYPAITTGTVVVAPPITSFSASVSSVAQGGTVTFTDTSTNTPTTWAWNFGTGASPATAATQGPHTVTYSTPGTSTVTLTAGNTGGSDASDPTSITVTALAVPVRNIRVGNAALQRSFTR